MELEGHLFKSPASGPSPGVLFIHGFPSGSISADHVGKDLEELAERVATEMGWTGLAIRLRGCGESTGDFSLGGWVEDALAGIRHLRTVANPARLWIVGFGTGGAVGLAAAVEHPDIVGVAVVGTPADFDDWAKSPDQLLAHARSAKAITDPDFPADATAWKKELSQIRASRSAEQFAPRPLLVLHGSEDHPVPPFDARMIADAHGEGELRIVSGAGHQLRHDPRAVAILLGWLERTRNL